GRLAHAYILIGPDGIGKEAAAIDLARLILCDIPDLGDHPMPCGACRNCKKTGRGVHPDLSILKPDGATIKVDQIRSLQQMISLAPLEAKRRVSILVNAHKMNNEAANALLKTLEEPPNKNHLFLTATSLERLVPTVVSRCQVLRCDALRRNEIERIIKEIHPSCPEEAAVFISNMSQGSIMRAAYLLERRVLEIRNEIFSFIDKDRPEAVPAFFNLSKKLSQDIDSALLTIQIMRSIVRDLVLIFETSRPGRGGAWSKPLTKDILHRHLINPDRFQALQIIRDKIDRERLCQYKNLLDSAEAMIERNINRELIIEALLVFWIRRGY
ncbi:MAG: DNA polymerase III subunit delta', partial [Dissulfurimicrobium sp.]